MNILRKDILLKAIASGYRDSRLFGKSESREIINGYYVTCVDIVCENGEIKKGLYINQVDWFSSIAYKLSTGYQGHNLPSRYQNAETRFARVGSDYVRYGNKKILGLFKKTDYFKVVEQETENELIVGDVISNIFRGEDYGIFTGIASQSKQNTQTKIEIVTAPYFNKKEVDPSKFKLKIVKVEREG